MQFLILAIVAALFGASVPSGPVVAPLDQSSDVIVVGNVVAGARVDVYANAIWIGAAMSPGRVVWVKPVRHLLPGDAVVAVVRIGSSSNYGLHPTIVSHDYATYHYDNGRTGWDQSETVLTQSRVHSSRFGQIFSTPVDGNVFAQPLELSGVDVPGQGTHDVVYAATENDSLYALDAASGAVLWAQNYVNGARGYAPVAQPDIQCPFIAPVIGITGTPVVDRASGTMYFDTAEKRTLGVKTTFHHFLHAVDVTTGLDRTGSPVEVKASFTAPGGGKATFDPQWQLQRPGLLLSGGVVYVAYGSFCDLDRRVTHGWVLAYSASTLAQLGAFSTSPGSQNGLSSVWAGGYGVAADESGDLYLATGNGNFDGDKGGSLWGDTVLKLSPTLNVLDYFTPHDQAMLNNTDGDLGSGGPMVLPPQAGAFPNLLVEVGKSRTLYLMSRNKLGGYTHGGPDAVLQELPGAVGTMHGVWGGPGYYTSPNGTPVVFYCGGGDHLKAFAVMTSPMTGLMQIDRTNMTFRGEGGSIPGVTSNGVMAGTPVVWLVERPFAPTETVRLTAFSADNLQHKLLDLPAGPWFNSRGGFFAVPTVINGRAYVGSANAVTGFGLH